MNSALSSLERLEVESACQRLVYEYMRALDENDWDRLANCFVELGVLARPMQPEQLLAGRAAIQASMRARPKGLTTRHLATNVIIDVVAANSATGVTTFAMIGCTPAQDAKPPFESAGPLYFGEFHDRFVREGGQWKFLERRGSIAVKY
jgi:hypothetical protein